MVLLSKHSIGDENKNRKIEFTKPLQIIFAFQVYYSLLASGSVRKKCPFLYISILESILQFKHHFIKNNYAVVAAAEDFFVLASFFGASDGLLPSVNHNSIWHGDDM